MTSLNLADGYYQYTRLSRTVPLSWLGFAFILVMAGWIWIAIVGMHHAFPAPLTLIYAGIIVGTGATSSVRMRRRLSDEIKVEGDTIWINGVELRQADAQSKLALIWPLKLLPGGVKWVWKSPSIKRPIELDERYLEKTDAFAVMQSSVKALLAWPIVALVAMLVLIFVAIWRS